jgi:hypothetical protein
MSGFRSLQVNHLRTLKTRPFFEGGSNAYWIEMLGRG